MSYSMLDKEKRILHYQNRVTGIAMGEGVGWNIKQDQDVLIENVGF